MKIGDIVRAKDRKLPVKFKVTDVSLSPQAEPLMSVLAIRPYDSKHEDRVAFVETHLVLQSAFTKVGTN